MTVTTSDQINEIAGACAKAQLDLKPAAKDAKNPHYNSRYADLAAIIEAAHVYAKHTVAIFQDVTTTEAGVSVSTRLVHGSGQWIEFGPLTVPLGKRDAHGVGSATTYAKRYALQAAALIPSDDDDGNAASQPAPTRPQAAPKVPEGFEDWLTDLEATADEGTAALEVAWKKSQPYLRKYLTDTDPSRWERIKGRAAKTEAA
jgi:hypothetical protein